MYFPDICLDACNQAYRIGIFLTDPDNPELDCNVKMKFLNGKIPCTEISRGSCKNCCLEIKTLGQKAFLNLSIEFK